MTLLQPITPQGIVPSPYITHSSKVHMTAGEFFSAYRVASPHCAVLLLWETLFKDNTIARQRISVLVWMMAGWCGVQINAHLPCILGTCPLYRQTGSWELQCGVAAGSCFLRLGALPKRYFWACWKMGCHLLRYRALQINLSHCLCFSSGYRVVFHLRGC